MFRKPAIISLKGYKLDKFETLLLKQHKPWGIILFKRNINNFKQLKKLTYDIRKCVNDPFYPILVDEEGGIVSRFSNLLNTKEFSQNFFGKLFEKNKKNAKLIYEYYLNSICSVLKSTGININTIPVLDLLQKNTHKIIRTRTYSKNTRTVFSMGKICMDVLKKNKIGSVSKHIPGHGCAEVDSHKKKPTVNFSFNKLYKNDFSLFKKISSPFVMTAHIKYTKIDPLNVATHSEYIIKNLIRNKLKYTGLIISDDISMSALSDDIVFNAKKALKSGCNLILYCRGNLKESKSVLRGLNKMDKFTEKKTHQFYQFLR